MIPSEAARRKSARLNPMLTEQTHSPPMSPPVLPADIRAFNERSQALGWPFTASPAGDFAHDTLKAALHAVAGKGEGPHHAEPRRDDGARHETLITQMSLIERLVIDGPAALSRAPARLLAGALFGRFDRQIPRDVVSDPQRFAGYEAVYDLMHVLQKPLRVVSHYQAPEISYLTGESLLGAVEAASGGPALILSVTYAKPRANSAALKIPSNELRIWRQVEHTLRT
ncbi:MAG: hypothetical protein WDM81_16350 [Rhizomicrobium sp.]